MVGTAAHGQLNAGASAQHGSRIRFAVATPDDDSAIRRLLRDTPMRGAITLTFEREPDYFAGAGMGGGDDHTIVASESDRLICMGRCTARDCWVNGRVQRIGYLAELRLDAMAHGRFDVLRGGYRFFRELQGEHPPALFFTSIASDNEQARRLLERGAPGLPRYDHLGGLTTLVISTRGRFRPARDLQPAAAEQVAACLNESGSRGHLAAAWTPSAIRSLARHDLTSGDFGVMRDRDRIVGAAALWDQRRFRQTVIRGYASPLAVVRPVVNAVGAAFGLPRLPDPGFALSQAFLSPLALPDAGDPHLVEDFVAAFCARAAMRHIDLLTLCLPSRDSRLSVLQRRFRCRAYHSRLYRVTWPGDPVSELDDRPVWPDVSLL